MMDSVTVGMYMVSLFLTGFLCSLFVDIVDKKTNEQVITSVKASKKLAKYHK